MLFDKEIMEVAKKEYEILSDLYAKVRNLQKSEKNNNEKLKDSPACQQIHQLIDEGIGVIDNSIKTSTTSKNPRLLAMKTTLLYEKSKILVCEEKEDLAEEILSNSLKTIDEFLSTSEIIFLALRIINHYSYLLMKRDNYAEAQRILEKGDSIYREEKSKNFVILFFTNEELFSSETTGNPSDSSKKLERLVTSNLQMLSMIYEKLELHERFAECQHEVLERQLETCGDEMLMWPIRSTKLACFFMAKNRFKEARNHLAAATQILCKYEDNLKSVETTKTSSTIQSPDLQQKFADVANCWVKYGLALFNSSKMSAMTHFCQDSNEMLAKLWDPPFKATKSTRSSSGIDEKIRDVFKSPNNEKPSQRILSSISEDEESNLQSSHQDLNQPRASETAKFISEYNGPLWLFQKLELNEYEEGVTASLIESTEEARSLFQHTHTWLKRVKLFYSLQDHPMEYVNTIMDLNELYRYLAFYEEDIESQYAVHKLRADALETLSAVLREVRPQCYMAVSVEILRELAEVQMEMMGLNLRKIYAAQTALPDANQTIRKIETLHDLNVKLKRFESILPELEASNSSHL